MSLGEHIISAQVLSFFDPPSAAKVIAKIMDGKPLHPFVTSYMSHVTIFKRCIIFVLVGKKTCKRHINKHVTFTLTGSGGAAMQPQELCFCSNDKEVRKAFLRDNDN